MQSEKTKPAEAASRGRRRGESDGARAWFRRANDYPGTCHCGRDVLPGDGLWAGKIYCRRCAEEVRSLGA